MTEQDYIKVARLIRDLSEAEMDYTAFQATVADFAEGFAAIAERDICFDAKKFIAAGAT